MMAVIPLNSNTNAHDKDIKRRAFILSSSLSSGVIQLVSHRISSSSSSSFSSSLLHNIDLPIDHYDGVNINGAILIMMAILGTIVILILNSINTNANTKTNRIR